MAIPLIFVTIMSLTDPSGLYRDSLGRSAFMLLSVALVVFTWMVLGSRKGVFKDEVGMTGWRWRIRFFWYPLAQILPLLMILLAAQGYVYTGVSLTVLTYRSVIVVIIAFMLYLIAVRWLALAHRRLALKRLRARREAELEARASREAAEDAGEMLPESLDTDEGIGLETINEQTRRLLRWLLTSFVLVAFWFLWADVLPALSVLDKITLWEYRVSGPEGTLLVVTSMADASLAILVLAITFIAERNLPGLLEIAVLQPLALEPGNRYAVTAISRYSILTVGILLAFKLIGMGWNDVQWLVAAVGVGLGFGLKEIFANFISGLIILFERPVRIGNTVTIGGDFTGTVSRIRIRATTITDWDNKDMVIPNQKLVIEPLINWTLSDQITRVTFMVGVAYGSDTEKTHRIMTETVQANPLVLEDPKPTVFFIGFGESSLDFQVRVFVRERVMRTPLTHELHMALEKALRENGIEIPFPQRDLHLRSADPGTGIISKEKGDGGDKQ